MYLSKNLEMLSDVELYQQLKYYGFPNVPVTETTRKLLINKLKKHISQQQKSDAIKRNTKYSPKTTNRTSAPQPLGLDEYNTYNRPGILSSNVYVPPPIVGADSDEDCSPKPHVRTTDSSRNICNDVNQIGAVNRLLSLRDTTLSKKPLQLNKGTNASYAKNVNNNNLATHLTKVKTFSRNLIRQPGLKQIFIPHVLLLGLCVFFVILAFIYIFITPDFPNNISESNANFILCSDSSEMPNSDKCIPLSQVPKAINLNKKLIELLQKRAKQHHCVNKSIPPTLSSTEFFQHMADSVGIHDPNTLESLSIVNHLIRNNPQWKVDIKDISYKRVGSDSDGEQLIANAIYLLQSPKLPVLCMLHKKLQRFFVIIGTAGAIALVGFLLYIAYNYMERRKADRQALVEGFTKEIMKELINRAVLKDGSNEIIINHLRDKLIPLQKRSSLTWAWNEAMRLLEATESRIQIGISTYHGEEVRTMKWIGNCENDYKLSYSKQWQSPAFDNKSQIVKPPTPCLKIRHMFDIDEVSNPSIDDAIKKAILEKVGGKCTIYDIQLDKQSCCVYLRCATEEDAGIVHTEINGWWFDKRLVSIKFLRLERYLSRFPNSAISSSFAKPKAFN